MIILLRLVFSVAPIQLLSGSVLGWITEMGYGMGYINYQFFFSVRKKVASSEAGVQLEHILVVSQTSLSNF